MPSSTKMARLIADTVTAVPGVVRLEPTLQNTMKTMLGSAADLASRGHAASGTLPGAVVGVLVTMKQGRAGVRIDLAVDSSRSASTTSQAVEQAVLDVLLEHGQLAGALVVTVLAIEPAQSVDRT